MALTNAFDALASDARARIGGARFVATISNQYENVVDTWETIADAGAALPFQRRAWLAPWYRAHVSEHIQPVLVTLTDASTREAVMALPLVHALDNGLRTIGFADFGLTDYNAPILGRSSPADANSAQAMWKAVCAVLPAADVIRFSKMPEMVGGMPNPLALLRGTQSGTLNGNILHVSGAWDEWHYGLERTFRKELERSLRVFLKYEGAAFGVIHAPSDRAQVFDALKQQQRERIGELGLPYILDEPRPAALYDSLVGNGDGILTALTVGDEVVAALLGIRQGSHYAMVRLSTGGEKWKACSPGRLLIERTMRALHQDGCRTFDFTIGDYAYKRRMGVTAIPLRDFVHAASWRGIKPMMRARAAALIRRSPRLRSGLRTVLGRLGQ